MDQFLAYVLGSFFAAAAERSQVGVQAWRTHNRQAMEFAYERQREIGEREKLDPGAVLDLAQVEAAHRFAKSSVYKGVGVNGDLDDRHRRDEGSGELESRPARERPLHLRAQGLCELGTRELHWVAQDAMCPNRFRTMVHQVCGPRFQQAGRVSDLPAGADTARAAPLLYPTPGAELAQKLRRLRVRPAGAIGELARVEGLARRFCKQPLGDVERRRRPAKAALRLRPGCRFISLANDE